MVHSLRTAVAEARRHGDLYFAALVPQDRIEKAFGTARWFWQGWIYTPVVTVWVFLSQCLSSDCCRLWKVELQKLSNATGLEIEVCHFPPGTSKWNKIEHRLFCHVTRNWRGQPLESYEIVVNLIGSTTGRLREDGVRNWWCPRGNIWRMRFMVDRPVFARIAGANVILVCTVGCGVGAQHGASDVSGRQAICRPAAATVVAEFPTPFIALLHEANRTLPTNASAGWYSAAVLEQSSAARAERRLLMANNDDASWKLLHLLLCVPPVEPDDVDLLQAMLNSRWRNEDEASEILLAIRDAVWSPMIDVTLLRVAPKEKSQLDQIDDWIDRNRALWKGRSRAAYLLSAMKAMEALAPLSERSLTEYSEGLLVPLVSSNEIEVIVPAIMNRLEDPRSIVVKYRNVGGMQEAPILRRINYLIGPVVGIRPTWSTKDGAAEDKSECLAMMDWWRENRDKGPQDWAVDNFRRAGRITCADDPIAVIEQLILNIENGSDADAFAAALAVQALSKMRMTWLPLTFNQGQTTEPWVLDKFRAELRKLAVASAAECKLVMELRSGAASF